MIKKWMVLLCFTFSFTAVFSQVSETEQRLLVQLDSIRNSPSAAKYFAAIYLETTARAALFFQDQDPGVQLFIDKLEDGFAAYFFQAVQAASENKPVSTVWKAYFKDSTLTGFQFQLLGINAHINGDLGKALISGFTLEEILQHKKDFLRFQRMLSRQFDAFYEKNYTASKKLAALHKRTFGLDKLWGKSMLLRWRKRQLKLAILYYKNRGKFEKKRFKVNLKMEQMNQLVLRHL